MTYPYGEKPRYYTPAPKPANFDAMSAAWNDDDQFQLEVERYRDQCSRAGIYPGRADGGAA